MRVDVPMSYPASPHAVVAMLVDRAYQERKCAALDARHVRYHQSSRHRDAHRCGGPGDAALRCAGRRPRDGPVRHPCRRDRQLGTRGDDGSRAAAIRLDFPHHPLTLRGTLSLEGADGGTRATVAGRLRAAVPFVAGRIERMAAKLVVRAITIEHGVGCDWLAGDDRQH